MAYTNYSKYKTEYKDMIDYCKRLNIGDKIKFVSEKQKYTIKAKSNRYLICTKPFNPQRTVLYTIIDLERLVRGTNNMLFNPYEYTNQEHIDECLKDLRRDYIEVSHRNSILLDVEY